MCCFLQKKLYCFVMSEWVKCEELHLNNRALKNTNIFLVIKIFYVSARAIQSSLITSKKYKKQENIESETRYENKAKKLKKWNWITDWFTVYVCCVFLNKKNSNKQSKINSKPRFFLVNQIQMIRQLQRFCEFQTMLWEKTDTANLFFFQNKTKQ